MDMMYIFGFACFRNNINLCFPPGSCMDPLNLKVKMKTLQNTLQNPHQAMLLISMSEIEK